MVIDFRQYVEGEKLSLSSPLHVQMIQEMLEEVSFAANKRFFSREDPKMHFELRILREGLIAFAANKISFLRIKDIVNSQRIVIRKKNGINA